MYGLRLFGRETQGSRVSSLAARTLIQLRCKVSNANPPLSIKLALAWSSVSLIASSELRPWQTVLQDTAIQIEALLQAGPTSGGSCHLSK